MASETVPGAVRIVSTGKFDQAADAIVALIYSKPRTSTKDQVVAVLAAHFGTATPMARS